MGKQQNTSDFAIAACHGASNTASRILDAAVLEFDELGFEKASFASVAKRSGMSKSLVSYHFPTKTMLGCSVLNTAYPSGIFMGAGRQAESPLAELLSAATSVALHVVHTPLARAALKLRRELEGIADGIPGRYSGWTAHAAGLLGEAQRAELIDATVNIGFHSRLIVGTVAGLISVSESTGSFVTLPSDVNEAIRCQLSVWGPIGDLPVPGVNAENGKLGR
ncbi:TetR/AcrR family transcriptional regulator [Arthrobacter alpinus]|uniref:TetR/AcrR family transcriptional regulator n=1 Tax=Arthrobacter alpinus TaxID=656366 RepID=UPI0016482D7F|nr:TetR/AcrR family transcriptional regulator [Arthrobacter alpinus]